VTGVQFQNEDRASRRPRQTLLRSAPGCAAPHAANRVGDATPGR